LHHRDTRGLAERLGIGAQGGARGGAVLDAGQMRGAARQRLEAECAAAREDVKHARIDQRRGAVLGETAVLQDVEQRLARAVRRWPHVVALRRRDPAPPMLSGHDAHCK
jgi:hypothetical protein